MSFDRRLVIVAVLVALGGLVAFGELWPGSAPAVTLPPLAVTQPAARDPVQQPPVVDVVGAVRRPGVYRLAVGARVRDALRKAGGATPRALVSAVNLAQLVADGEQIVVPARPIAAAPGAATTTAPTPTVVHLNSATVEQLDALDGIGPSLARRIVDYRLAHGGFRSIDELDEVSGIGPTRLASLKGRLAL